MNKMFKILAVLLMLILTMTALVACDLGGGDEDAAIDYDHTIIFYSSQGTALQPVTEAAINAFEAKYPGYKVEHVTPGGYDEVKAKIVSDLSANLQPDVAYCYADHVAQYMQTGKVLDMNSLINSTETVNGYTVGYSATEIADFIEGYYKEGLGENYGDYAKYGYQANSMLTLPFVKSTELLYYNADALIAAGLYTEDGQGNKIPTVAKTWDELWEQCATLKKKFPNDTPLGYDSEANWFITMCQQNGWGYTSASGNHYTFNNENTKAWLESLAEYYGNGYIVTQEIYGSYTSTLFTNGCGNEDTTKSGIVYCIGSSGGASHQSSENFTWGVAPIPGSVIGEGESATVNSSAISQGPSLVMFKNDQCSNADEKAKMTFLFVKELLDPTFQAAFSKASGYNPSRNSVYSIPAYEEHMEGTSITAVASKVAKGMVKDFFTSPAFVGSSEARTQVGNVLVYTLTGQKDAETALAQAYKNCGGK